MARYTVLQPSFINNSLVQPGVEIEYDGEPGPNLKPVEVAVPKKAKKAAASDNAEQAAASDNAEQAAASDNAEQAAASDNTGADPLV